MSQTNKVHLWVRAETKKNEQRTALTPNNCKSLIDKGFDITVEDSPQSIFKISEYTALKIPTVKAGEWQTKAPKNAFILGLKELPEVAEGDALYELVHRHIMFAHCYKGQDGWKGVLDRFVKGKTGKLFDLEFLTDVTGRRVAAFGYYAGFAGAAVAVDVWCHRMLNGNDAPYPSIKPYSNQSDLIEYIKSRLSLAKVKNNNVLPKVFVIGALGRCGKGAVDFSELVGITKKNLIKWDIQETSLKPGPYAELLTTEIFINCIYLSKPIPPFLNTEFLHSNETTRKLNVICDVSCDATNPHNPIPVYWGSTTFDDPLVRVMKESKNPIDVIAIDHLPTLLPRESSEFFGKDLQDSLVALQSYEKGRVWNDAENLFWKKVGESGK